MWLGHDPLVAQVSSTKAGNANRVSDNFSFDQNPQKCDIQFKEDPLWNLTKNFRQIWSARSRFNLLLLAVASPVVHRSSPLTYSSTSSMLAVRNRLAV